MLIQIHFLPANQHNKCFSSSKICYRVHWWRCSKDCHWQTYQLGMTQGNRYQPHNFSGEFVTTQMVWKSMFFFSSFWCCIKCEHPKRNLALAGNWFLQPIQKMEKYLKNIPQNKTQIENYGVLWNKKKLCSKYGNFFPQRRRKKCDQFLCFLFFCIFAQLFWL